MINDLLSNSEYYKRDFPKYNNLLKVISVFNYHHKIIYERDDRKLLYVSAEDVQLFLTLLNKYELSISENLSLHATDVIKELMELEKQPQTNDDGQPTLEVGGGWTINDYLEYSQLNLSKRSLQNYFKELNSRGFVRVIERKGNAYVYELTGKFNKTTLEEHLALSPKIKKIISDELGEEILTILEEDKPIPGLTIMDHDDSIRKPNW